jgi:hypothetical protein
MFGMHQLRNDAVPQGLRFMSSKTGTWIIAAGVVLMFVGLCFFSALLSDHPEPDMLEFGACQFSLGALVIAAGIYAKARTIQFAIAAGEPRKESSTSNQRVRAAATCAAPRLQRCNAKSTNFISVETVWLSTTMFAPAPMCPLPAPPTRPAGTRPRMHEARSRCRFAHASPARCSAKVTGVTWSNYVT